MPSKKKLTMTTPETQPDLTMLKLIRAEVNFQSGEVSGTYVKMDTGETVEVPVPYHFQMATDAVLKNIENEVLTEGQSAGAFPAGTIADI